MHDTSSYTTFYTEEATEMACTEEATEMSSADDLNQYKIINYLRQTSSQNVSSLNWRV